MTYTTINFSTKKALKDALARGEEITIFEPGPFPCKTDGTVYLEGPHYPQPHRWYAQATIVNGKVVKIK